MSAEKPVSGFAKKRALEDIGCQFEKEKDRSFSALSTDTEWVCYMDGKEIGRARLQADCLTKAIDSLGGL